ncbi:MAG: hypothetical protein QM751_00490 [Paludibacteraceae bacterium]
MELEEYELSLVYINSALELDDKASDVWVYYAEANIGLNSIDEALIGYLKSISLDPSQPDTLMAVASIYMDKANFENAIRFYEQAYSFDTNLELIELFMAVGYYYVGNMEKMEHFLQLAVQKNLDSLKLFFDFCPDAEINI